MAKRRMLSHLECWENFSLSKGKMMLPTGQEITPQELLIGIALLSIQSEIELKTSSKILKTARALIKLKGL